MLNKEEEVESIKILLIGDEGVGKSLIISRYKYIPFYENMETSFGASYCSKKIQIGDKIVKLNIWHSLSQKRKSSISKLFYKNAFVVCLVYDITNKDSFEDLKNIWYPDLQNNGEKYTILAVVGNKSDLFIEEQITEDEGKQYAKEINAIFMLTSAKTGDAIDILFESLAKKYLSPENKSIIDEMKKERSLSFNLNDIKSDEYCKKKKCC